MKQYFSLIRNGKRISDFEIRMHIERIRTSRMAHYSRDRKIYKREEVITVYRNDDQGNQTRPHWGGISIAERECIVRLLGFTDEVGILNQTGTTLARIEWWNLIPDMQDKLIKSGIIP